MPRFWFARTMIAAALGACCLAPALAQQAGEARGFAVEEVVNERAGFLIRVDVDRADRVYYEGEPMTVSVTAEKDCYVYLLYYLADGSSLCLYPNRLAKDNLLKGKVPMTYPARGANFAFRTRPPYGEELLQVVATTRPVDLFPGKPFQGNKARPFALNELKKGMEVVQQEKPGDWAEARVPIRTVAGKRPDGGPSQSNGQQAGPKRVGVFVGISEYKDPRVPRLRVCHSDARAMAQAMVAKCGLSRSDVTVLTNRDATLKAIRQAIFEQLPRKTRPGDTVVIYFSCHGGRCADTNGDEPDGLDEYLVPYDGTASSPETMLLDDTFARWMAELSGRKILVVLDNCYSGGSSKGIKGLEDARNGRDATLDSFEVELRRAKDLGQGDTTVLAASLADQVAWEMAEGTESVLTHFLLGALDDARTDANGDGKITPNEVFNAIKDPVKVYVQKTFNAVQTPLIIDNANDSIVVRPVR